jgi:hypothetical protein
MKTMLITYEICYSETSDEYKRLIEHLMSYPNWANPLKSIWLVKTKQTITAVREALKSYIVDDDKILVIDVTKSEWATSRVSREVSSWMRMTFS